MESTSTSPALLLIPMPGCLSPSQGDGDASQGQQQCLGTAGISPAIGYSKNMNASLFWEVHEKKEKIIINNKK